jgi:hypothetical protein
MTGARAASLPEFERSNEFGITSVKFNLNLI